MVEHDDEEGVTAEEQAQAEALARALDGQASSPDGAAPADALETAALLRYAAGDGELDEGRAEAVLDALWPPGAQRPGDPSSAPALMRARARWRGPALAAALGFAAAAAALLWSRPGAEVAAPADGPQLQAPSEAATLPAPPTELLRAQAAAARDPATRDALDTAMGSYREAVLRRLAAQYPAHVGMLEAPAPRRLP